jgi:hypothetical protein
VIDAISKLDPARKCFRLIGGVLVERNVGEVLPAVQKNCDGVRNIISPNLHPEFAALNLNAFSLALRLCVVASVGFVQISATIQQIGEAMKKKESSFQDFISKYGRFLSAQQRRQPADTTSSSLSDEKSEAKSSGVLV